MQLNTTAKSGLSRERSAGITRNYVADNTNSSLIMPIGACSESCVLGTAQAKETMSVPVEVG